MARVFIARVWIYELAACHRWTIRDPLYSYLLTTHGVVPANFAPRLHMVIHTNWLWHLTRINGSKRWFALNKRSVVPWSLALKTINQRKYHRSWDLKWQKRTISFLIMWQTVFLCRFLSQKINNRVNNCVLNFRFWSLLFRVFIFEHSFDLEVGHES